jgi:serine protease Do
VNYTLKSVIACLFLLFGSFVNGAENDFNRVFINAANQARQSVVNIIIYKSSDSEGRKLASKTGYGSGTIISRGGYIVTNYHVVKKGNYFQAFLYDGTECGMKKFNNGKYYLADEKTDIAVMRLDVESIPSAEISPIEFGDSGSLSEGEWVLAIGNPYGLRQSVTSGIVSSKGRNDIGFAEIEDFIQTDVPINPGNSGGPLINLKGQLVGINTAIRTVSGGYQGISFAIPSNIVRSVSSELVRAGRVSRGWLGFIVKERTIYTRGERSVLEVISVLKNSPAESAGISRGDIIKEVDGKEVGTLGEIIKIVATMSTGSRLRITVSRGGHLTEFSLVLREKGVHRRIQKGLRSISSTYGIELDENARTGEVVITYLSPMGEGYRRGLMRGDVIVSVNGSSIKSLEEFINICNKSGSKISRVDIFRDKDHISIEFGGSPE